MRVIEFILLLTPVAAYVLWRVLIARHVPNPSRQTLIAVFAAIAVLSGTLLWLSLSERHGGRTRYVPAQLENGRVIPGHGA